MKDNQDTSAGSASTGGVQSGAANNRPAGRARIWKILGAGGYGAVMFALAFGLAEASHWEGDWLVVLGGVGVFFFTGQFLFSRGNPAAVRTDWSIILAMNALMLGIVGAAVIGHFQSLMRHPQEMLSAVGTVVMGLGGAYAGALFAGRLARRRAGTTTPGLEAAVE